MDDTEKERQIVELVTWLENTAREAKAVAIAKDWTKTCRAVIWVFDSTAGPGVFELQFILPVSEVRKAFPWIDDIEAVARWFHAINDREIIVDLGVDNRPGPPRSPDYGPCFRLRRLFYVPREERERGRWLDTLQIPLDDLNQLRVLLNKPPLTQP